VTRITLPFPPSVNDMFVNAPGKGRVKSKKYASWTTEAMWSIKSQKIKPIEGEVSISIGLVAPNRRPMDADNRVKAILDAITGAGVIQDDNNRFVRRLSVEWLPSGEPCTVIIQQIEAA